MLERQGFAAIAAKGAAAVVVLSVLVVATAASGSALPKLGALPADGSLVQVFAFDPRASETVYAATIGGHVFKTTDGGRHWRLTTAGSISDRVDALVADPERPGTLYAGTGVAVYKTVNGGRSWRGYSRGLLPPPPVIAPGQVTATPGHREAEGWVGALAVDPADSHIVYAGTGGGVRKSTDGGHSWKTVLWRGRYMFVSALVIAPVSPQVVYAVAYVDEPADCGAGGTIPCRSSELLYASQNGGTTWRTVLRRANPKGYFAALALDPQHPTTLYVALGPTVRRSTDAGHSWRSIRNGLPWKVVGVLAVDPHRSGTVYAGLALSGIYKTTDGGLTWRRTIPGFSVAALAVDPARPATIYASGQGFTGAPVSESRILRSTDSGRTWAIAG